MTIKETISKGDIIRCDFPRHTDLPIYMGSGSAGCCFDAYGFMNDDVYYLEKNDTRYIPADALKFKHFEHYKHGKYGLDSWVSLYRLKFAKLPEAPTDYMQNLQLYCGRLTSKYTLKSGTSAVVTNYFNPYSRDVLAIEIEHSGAFPKLMLCPEKCVSGAYDQTYSFKTEMQSNGFVVDTGTVRTAVKYKVISESGNCSATPLADGNINFDFLENGHHIILIGACNESRKKSVEQALENINSIKAYRDECEKAYVKRYGDSYVHIPDEYFAKMWARSLYYVLCSFAPDGIPSAPMGWSGYGWKFHFPQDISYIHPALLRLGHTDIAKGIVDFYRTKLDCMKENTKRIYGGRGVMWAWEFPICGKPDLLIDSVPNPYQFEIHNASYPARMAYETSCHLKDEEWFKLTALPIIRESAEFYASHMIREKNGKWSLSVTPSMSQDEFADPNSKNYLCSLYAAQYTFNTAKKCGLHEYDKFISDGLSFDRLYDEKVNLYRTSEQMTFENWWKERHPVQLNPITFLPKEHLDKAEVNAYKQMENICSASKDNWFYGWTLSAFWLAASHMGDSKTFLYELERAKTENYTDREQLEFYESSSGELAEVPYYITTHGFYLQAVDDAFICDLFGKTTKTAAIPKEWSGAEYHNLHTKDGVFSGKV